MKKLGASKCTVCEGEGGWYDHYVPDVTPPWVECRYCGSTGKVTLWVRVRDRLSDMWYES